MAIRETYFKHPTGRLSDGRIVPDFIAQLAKLPILRPYLQPGSHQFTDGASFASSGAGVLAETHPGTEAEKSLRRRKLDDAHAKKVLNRAVYLFSIGGNNYFSFTNTKTAQTHRYVETVIGNLTSVLKNVGPLGCAPVMKAMDPNLGNKCAKEASTLARIHNRYLAVALKKLESELYGFKYSIFDYYQSLEDRVNNPSKYGFKERKAACCGSGTYRGSECGGGMNGTQPSELCSYPGEYVWFDGGHTTEKANHQLAELLWNGVPNVTGPYNIKQLFELE